MSRLSTDAWGRPVRTGAYPTDRYGFILQNAPHYDALDDLLHRPARDTSNIADSWGRKNPDAGADVPDDVPATVRAAKESVKVALGKASWLRGVGIGGSPGHYAVAVRVQKPEHISLVRALIGSSVGEVPIEFAAVGDIVALGADAALPPPPGGTSSLGQTLAFGAFLTLLLMIVRSRA